VANKKTARAVSEPVPSLPTDRRTQQQLYERYLPIVRRIAMRTVRSLPPSITIDDVVSAGWLGMVEALGRRTDEMTDDHFEAFASYRVRGAILDYLRMLDPMSRKLRGASRRITKTVSDLVARLGRAPEQEEVAAELGIELSEYQGLLGEISEAGFARLEVSDLAEPAGEASPEAQASRRELVGAVASAVEKLPDRLQMIVGLYYQEECSFREIGEVLGVTESRVCQLHSEAMHIIRASLDGRPVVRHKRRRSRAAVGESA
jgi:RNA polymerase sigma factor for flagellar operon FliA